MHKHFISGLYIQALAKTTKFLRKICHLNTLDFFTLQCVYHTKENLQLRIKCDMTTNYWGIFFFQLDSKLNKTWQPIIEAFFLPFELGVLFYKTCCFCISFEKKVKTKTKNKLIIRDTRHLQFISWPKTVWLSVCRGDHGHVCLIWYLYNVEIN